jgi:hypothetical protein
VDLRQLEVFLAVMEHSSVTWSAEKLYLSPGAVASPNVVEHVEGLQLVGVTINGKKADA